MSSIDKRRGPKFRFVLELGTRLPCLVNERICSFENTTRLRMELTFLAFISGTLIFLQRDPVIHVGVLNLCLPAFT